MGALRAFRRKVVCLPHDTAARKWLFMDRIDCDKPRQKVKRWKDAI